MIDPGIDIPSAAGIIIMGGRLKPIGIQLASEMNDVGHSRCFSSGGFLDDDGWTRKTSFAIHQGST